MNGYGSHTYAWVNANGDPCYVKYHFKTDQGIESFTDADAKAMTSEDPDYHRRDLHEYLEHGNEASWTLEMQIMPIEDAAGYRFNPFDITKVWPHSDYPPLTVGRLVLNRNPENYFEEVEQSAFEPANMVPGIEPSPDKMLLGRLFSYPDSHRHRIGTNYQQLPINRPRSPVHSYNKDGAMRYKNTGDPVYAPNSMGGPAADPQLHGEAQHMQISGRPIRAPYDKHSDDDDFAQPGALYRDVLSETEREHLTSNIAAHAGHGVNDEIQGRVIEYWRLVDADLGARVEKALSDGAT
jgi:catalase